MKKTLIILTILIIPLLLSGCYTKKTFTLDEYNEYLDNLKCGQSNKENTLCDIKGKYEVVSNNIDQEEKVEYRIKGTDLTFTVEQTLDCDTIDGSGCFNKKRYIK